MNDHKAVAQQLLCALDTYEAAFSAWAATPSLLDFSQVEQRLEKVRVLRMLVPQVGTEMAEVVTTHVDLCMMYVRDRTGIFGRQHSAEDLASARQRHSAATQSMRVHCRDVVNETSSSTKTFGPVVHDGRTQKPLATFYSGPTTTRDAGGRLASAISHTVEGRA